MNTKNIKLKCSPSLLGHPQSQEAQKDQKDQAGPKTDMGGVFKYCQNNPSLL